MKTLITSFLIYSFAFSINWGNDFVAAQKTAKENHQLIFLNFSGSDWCIPCMNLRKDFFETAIFKKMADADLVLVNADFPRKKKNKPAAEIIKQNNALAEKYNPQGTFPLTVLINADGKVLKTWNGKPDESVEKFTSEIEEVYNGFKRIK